ncbi:MAG: c-type cytochrome biogenesis protein CcsB [Candidatus Sumerlaeota bacterium]
MKMIRYVLAPLAGLLLIIALLSASSAQAQPPTGEAWEAVWDELSDMPVQTEGMVRSYRTFCRNQLKDIANETSWQGAGSVATITWLLSSPQNLMQTAIVPVEHPKIAQAYDSKTVSYGILTNDEMREKLTTIYDATKGKRQEALMTAISRMEGRLGLLQELPAQVAVAPREDGDWLSPFERAAYNTPSGMEIADTWETLMASVREDEPERALQAASGLKEMIEANASPEAIERVELDAFYMRAQPFARAALFYVLAAVAYGASLIVSRKRLAWFALSLMAVGLLINIAGIIMRWIISNRPPLSNAYETLIFTVAGLVLVAIIIEILTRIRLAGLSVSILGFIIVVLAHKAPIFYSEIRPLMPALQSAWLTYHVVTIMLSYACFLLSADFAIAYLLKELIQTRSLQSDDETDEEEKAIPASLQALDMLQYRLVAVGFPLLTIGIILGAVWAERAWGCPWGFDPKETWSAITWMVYAGYLHVRFLRGWRGTGSASPACCLPISA